MGTASTAPRPPWLYVDGVRVRQTTPSGFPNSHQDRIHADARDLGPSARRARQALVERLGIMGAMTRRHVLQIGGEVGPGGAA